MISPKLSLVCGARAKASRESHITTGYSCNSSLLMAPRMLPPATAPVEAVGISESWGRQCVTPSVWVRHDAEMSFRVPPEAFGWREDFILVRLMRDRGRDNRLQGHIRSGPRSCHWQKRRHRKRCRRRRDGPGTWLNFGIAQGIESITSVPFGEKENFADASPRVPARGPRRAPLSPPSGTLVHCGCAGARKGRGRPTFCI
jgi:hypothetical protein